MVQLFYYENRGRAARRILRHDSTLLGGGGWRWTAGSRSSTLTGGSDGGGGGGGGRDTDAGGCRVLLYPDEGWARPAALSSLLLQPVWWSRSRCRVLELCGTRRATAVGKISTAGNGNHVTVVGRFKEDATAAGAGATDGRDFKLTLSTDVTNADFQLGYCMTGTLERGNRKSGCMEMTHYAMVKRKGY